MATFLARIKVKPGREADFEHIVAEMYEATLALETRVRRYEYWRSSEAGMYYTYASFDDFLGFLEHQISDHHEAIGPKLKETVESIRLEWVDPVASSSSLVATDMQPLPDGASELAVKYHEYYAAEVQPWWLALR